jgi:uncharacterized protein YjbI with pentapeptide repeats
MKLKLSFIALFLMIFQAGNIFAQNALKTGKKPTSVVHGTKSTGKVLYFCDYIIGTDYMQQALNNVGYNYVLTADANAFADSIMHGNFDLGIFLCQGYGSTSYQNAVDSLSKFVSRGGNAIYFDYARDSINGSKFGVEFTANLNLASVTVTDTFLDYNLTVNPIPLVNKGWGTFSIGLKAAPGSDTSAVFENGNAAIIQGKKGNVLTLGFTNDAVPSTELFENAIKYMVKEQNADDRKFYFINRNDYTLRRCNPDGSLIETVMQVDASGSGQYGVAIDQTHKKIYWSDWSSSTVMCTDMNGANPITIGKDTLSQILGIAIDETGGKLYIADRSHLRLLRCNLNGTNFETLVQDTAEVTSVALDFETGKVYFTNSGQLKRANFDGTDVELLSTANVNFTAQIFIDSYHEKLYWANENGQTIVSSDINGANQNVIYTSSNYPEGVWYSRADNRLYFIEWSGVHGFFSMDTDGNNITPLYGGNTDFVGLYALEPAIPQWKATFTVSDGSGPVAGAEVNLDGNIATTDAEGTAILFDYYNGTYSYTVTKGGYLAASDDVTFTDNNINVPVTLTVDAVNALADNSIKISPNPSKGLFSVNTDESNGKIIIRDVTGKTIFEKQIIGNKSEIDFTNQAKGVYFIDIVTDKSIKTQKLVIE